MIFASPVPETLASGAYYDAIGSEYYLSPAKLDSDYAGVRFERELRIFRKHCREGAVLDVGCSTGAFLYHLAKRFPGDYELTGTDASGPALDYAQSKGARVIRGDFLQHDFGAATYDALTFWAVIEHLAHPGQFLEKACALLKEHGLCFVLVPNLKSLAARFLGGKYRYIYPQHLNYFTKATLMKLVDQRFEIVQSRFTHFNPVVIWQDWRSAGADVSNEDRARLLQRTTAYKRSSILMPIKVLYRLSELLLAEAGLADNLALVLKKR
jgi:2-polyprenyl-3-methyl-5-hydroxy-6-metoxy-1,4-benzoquinol methylase